MKILDPHVDIASIYDEFHIPVDDFFSDREDIPVTLKMLEDTGIDLIGTTLFIDPTTAKASNLDVHQGVMSYYKFYQELFSKTDKFVQIKSKADLETKPKDRIGYFYSVEGLECFRSDNDLDFFYNELGVRVFGLAWHSSNAYVSGNGFEVDSGVTTQGQELLRKMSGMKLIVDTAHLSPKSFNDLPKYYKGIIVNTHANARAVVDLPHNLSDEQIQMIVESGGMVGLLAIKDEIGGEGGFEDWYKHLEYIADKWGIDYIGLASDIFPLPEYPFVNDAQNIRFMKDFQEFLFTKMSAADVEKVCYGNFEDVLKRGIG